MLIPHKGHTDTIQVYSVIVMTHVKALQAGHSSQGTSEPITPVWLNHVAETFPVSNKLIHPVGRSIHRPCDYFTRSRDYFTRFCDYFTRSRYNWYNFEAINFFSTHTIQLYLPTSIVVSSKLICTCTLARFLTRY